MQEHNQLLFIQRSLLDRLESLHDRTDKIFKSAPRVRTKINSL
jgi:hypothetical protein